MRYKLVTFACAVTCAFSFLAPDTTNAATFSLETSDQGLIDTSYGSRNNPTETYTHDANNTSLTVQTRTGGSNSVAFTDSRGYLFFDIPMLTGSVSSVSLTFDLANLPSIPTIGQISAYSIETDLSDFSNDFTESFQLIGFQKTDGFDAAKALYDDLADGSDYGSTGEITNAPGLFGRGTTDGTYTIDFSADGIADVLSAQGGLFAMGLDFGGSFAAYDLTNMALTIETVPLPGAAATMIVGLGGLAVMRRRKRS